MLLLYASLFSCVFVALYEHASSPTARGHFSTPLKSEQLQVALQGLPGQFSDHFGDNHTLTVKKEGLRDAGDAIVDGSGAGVVCNVEVGDPIGVQEVQSIAVRILKIDAEEDDPLTLSALPRCLQERRFVLTGSAPGCPEVEHDGLSFQTGKMDG